MTETRTIDWSALGPIPDLPAAPTSGQSVAAASAALLETVTTTLRGAAAQIRAVDRERQDALEAVLSTNRQLQRAEERIAELKEGSNRPALEAIPAGARPEDTRLIEELTAELVEARKVNSSLSVQETDTIRQMAAELERTRTIAERQRKELLRLQNALIAEQEKHEATRKARDDAKEHADHLISANVALVDRNRVLEKSLAATTTDFPILEGTKR
ncbi:hypothetical protein EAH68_12695 [Corynebacterium hylobatis]|uniref:Uncharacterized protein n=1 Tax=Corynebacterium hylobatis TaxID=1859290 RepID=A0A430HVQ8_9CORY|nr:hypothetical protein [Corynebacterium hylobatis]RSZ61517.1 hypothetical protein EAH68_12695 [Corynebacterium hylobatis]